MEMTNKRMIEPIAMMMAFFIDIEHRTLSQDLWRCEGASHFAISESELYALKAHSHISRGQRPRKNAIIVLRPVRAGQNDVNPNRLGGEQSRTGKAADQIRAIARL
jgi:hypothetical protein